MSDPSYAPPVKKVPDLDQMPDIDGDELLKFTRQVRLRQIQHTLEKNGGTLPEDIEEAKLVLAQMKDLDSQVLKKQAIGAKERASAADREAALAVAKVLQMVNGDPFKRDAIEGTSRPVPKITDAAHLEPIKLVPDEIAVKIDDTTYDEFMERTLKEE